MVSAATVQFHTSSRSCHLAGNKGDMKISKMKEGAVLELSTVMDPGHASTSLEEAEGKVGRNSGSLRKHI